MAELLTKCPRQLMILGDINIARSVHVEVNKLNEFVLAHVNLIVHLAG
jgi:hypothetical protein